MEDAIKSEKAVNDALAAAWNAFVALERQHPDEADEFRHGIHALQGIMALRACRRLMPGVYPTYVVGVDTGAGDSRSVEGIACEPADTADYYDAKRAATPGEAKAALEAAKDRAAKRQLLGDYFPREHGPKCYESYEDVLGGGR